MSRRRWMSVPDGVRGGLAPGGTDNRGNQPYRDMPLIESRPLANVVASRTRVPLFEEVPSAQSGINFSLRTRNPENYIRELFFLSVHGGICTGDVNQDGLADIYVTSSTGNRLYLNRGGFRFQDVTSQAGILDESFWGTGATFVDIDNDGDLDIYACGYLQPNRLFINEGAEAGGVVRLVEQAERFRLAYNGASMTMAFADIDRDGDLDGYLATTAKPPPPGTKFRVRFEGAKPVVPQELREYWQVVYLPGNRAYRTEAGEFDHLFRNDGGHFTEVSESAGIDGPYFTLSVVWWDYNDDGFPDIYVSNDFLGPDRLYRNNGDGTFTDVARDVLPHTPWSSMGADLADVNNDGLVDFLAADMSARTHQRDIVMMGNMHSSAWFLETAEPRQYSRNALFINSGTDRLLESAHLSQVASTDWTWNPRFSDFDNDGRVDLFCTNGVPRDLMNSDISKYASARFRDGSKESAHFWAQQPPLGEPNIALKNLGDLKFDDVSAQWGLDRVGVSLGAATADFDNDGDLDLVVNNFDGPIGLYRNRSDTAHRVRIRLIGQTSNRFGVGSKVQISAGGLQQTFYLTLTRGWLSSNEPIVSFGLGDAERIGHLSVRWPSGKRSLYSDLRADQFYIVTEPPSGSSDHPMPSNRKTASEETFSSPSTDVTSRPDDGKALFVAQEVSPEIIDQETPFDDFALQPLLPAKLSQSGPVMAWADIDGDGDEDCYFGGSRGRSGRLLVNTANGLVPSAEMPCFAVDRECEDAGASFLDVDGDGDNDLYVASGSVEHKLGDIAYRDRLYLNDGHGQFFAAEPKAMPDHRDSGSVVAPCDFDRDGDMDLFVGSRCIPGMYPLPPANRLLVNAAGRFQEQTPPSLKAAGMVTDAEWSDIDRDGWIDLMLTVDRGPLRVFANQQGSLVEKTADAGLAKHLGWWMSVTPGDLDQDGDTDFVVTNLGLNTKYRASPEKPELLYYGDVDGSGVAQIVEATFENGVCYPRRDFDCSQEAMPFLVAKIKTFDSFGRASLADLYTQERLDKARKLEINILESGLLMNDGGFRFRFQPLPAIAQIAPGRDVHVADLNGDGVPDIVLAQNLFSPQRKTGRMDGGVGLLLLGTKSGRFLPIWPNRSGIVVPGEARCVHAVDINGDDRPDLVFGQQSGPIRVFLNHP